MVRKVHLRGLLLVLFASVACGCGNDVTRLDMDIELGSNYIAIYLTEPDRPCKCSGDSWPKPGKCVDVSDVIYCECDPYPGSCLKSLRLEKEGEVVTEVVPDFYSGYMSLYTGGLSPSFEYFLVLEGCGSSARIPIPNEAFPEPVITGVENDEYTLTVRWSSAEQAIGSIGLVGTLGGDKCHDVSEGITRMPCRTFLGAQDRLWMYVFDGGGEINTALGTARIWRGANSSLELYFPRKKENGLWSLPTWWRPDISVNIDGEESEGPLVLLSADVDVGESEPLVDLEGLANTNGGEFQSFGFRYTAGMGTDWLQIQTQDVFVGEFSHIIPVDGLDLGRPDNDTFVLEAGPVTLQREGDPATTMDVSFSLTWNMEIPVSRPVDQ